MAQKPNAKPPTDTGRRIPTWLVVALVLVVSAGAALAAAGVVIGVMIAVVGLPAEGKKKDDKLTLVKPVNDAAGPPDQQKKPNDEQIEPPAIAPPAKSDNTPVLILELPKPAGRSVLSADGTRVAYVTAKAGFFGYREGPAFDVEKEMAIDGASTAIHPLASSADGRLMALTSGSSAGPQVYVWNWDGNRLEAKFPISNLAASSAFSPDGNCLATCVPRPQKVGVQHWLHLHEISTRRMPSQWILGSELNFAAFTPDSNTILFASERDVAVRTWKRSTARPDPTMLFPKAQARHFFARNSSKVAYLENANQLAVLNGSGMTAVGKIETDRDTTLIHAAGFSADNRFVLLGVQDIANGEKPVPVWRGGKGHGRLVEIKSGKTVAVTDALDGVPDRVELASNGIGLLQSQRLRPRLYSFPTLGGAAAVKAPPTPADGFVPLFNGKDLTGWKPQVHPMLPGIWRVENGILTGSGMGKGGYRLYTERPQPRDFHLRLEARISNQGFGSLRFACPDGSILGFETPLNSNAPVEIKTGSLRAQIPSGRVDLAVVQNSSALPDQWFTMDIIAQGKRIIVKVNGSTTADIAEVVQPMASGHISLFQSGLTKLEFRRIEIKDLKPVNEPPIVPVDGFEPLFNGKDMTGWRMDRIVNLPWRVENGHLVGMGALGKTSGSAISEKMIAQDFHLRLEACVGDKGSFYLRFRCPRDNTTGYRVGFLAAKQGFRNASFATSTVGAIKVFPRIAESPVKIGEWFTMEIIAKGNRFELKVNGVTVVDVMDNTTVTPGHVRLSFTGECNIEIRRLDIKEFKSVPAPR